MQLRSNSTQISNTSFNQKPSQVRRFLKSKIERYLFDNHVHLVNKFDSKVLDSSFFFYQGYTKCLKNSTFGLTNNEKELLEDSVESTIQFCLSLLNEEY